MINGGQVIWTISEREKLTIKILNQLKIWDDDWLSLPAYVEITKELFDSYRKNEEWYNLGCLRYQKENFSNAASSFCSLAQQELEKGNNKDTSYIYKCVMNYARCQYLNYNGPTAPLEAIDFFMKEWLDIPDEYHDKLILCAILLALTDDYRNTMALRYFEKFRDIGNFYRILNTEYPLEKYFALLVDKLIGKYERTPSLFFKDQLIEVVIKNSYSHFALKLCKLNYLDAKENKDKNRIMKSFDWELKVYEKKNDYKSAADRLNEMAEYLLDHFNDEKGYLESMKKAISFYEESDNSDELLRTIETLLDFFSKNNITEGSKEYYKKAADLYLDLEELEKAAEMYEKAGIPEKAADILSELSEESISNNVEKKEDSMTCPNPECRHTDELGSNFCRKCGTRLISVCECGKKLELDSNFCPNCGKKI